MEIGKENLRTRTARLSRVSWALLKLSLLVNYAVTQVFKPVFHVNWCTVMPNEYFVRDHSKFNLTITELNCLYSESEDKSGERTRTARFSLQTTRRRQKNNW